MQQSKKFSLSKIRHVKQKLTANQPWSVAEWKFRFLGRILCWFFSVFFKRSNKAMHKHFQNWTSLSSNTQGFIKFKTLLLDGVGICLGLQPAPSSIKVWGSCIFFMYSMKQKSNLFNLCVRPCWTICRKWTLFGLKFCVWN